MRTPETLTAEQRARQLNLPERDTMSKSKSERAALEQVVANFDATTMPGDASAVSLAADADMSFAVLPIDEIEPYRYNPRTGANPRYEEIKASIRADGITNMLTVTRRDKSCKYTTYGGGNTRLLIAKELFAAGDTRFARLHVVVKTWPGDAQIITAQLVENENRGELTFWEKAQAVQQFKAEFEKESGTALSAGALHGELKKRGLGYGARTIQNFTFSVENLQPIGRWLTAAAVNETIRPAFSGVQSLMQRLGVDARQAKGAMEGALHECGKQMQAAEQRAAEAPDAVPVALDTPALIAALHAAAARVLDVDATRVPAMLAALKANPRMTPEALKQVQSVPEKKAKEAGQEKGETQEKPAAGSSAGAPAPLVVSTTQNHAPAGAAEKPATTEPAPTPQQQPVQPGLNGLLMPIPKQPPTPEPPAKPAPAQVLLAEIQTMLEHISRMCPMPDVMCASEDMPFGFLIDLPQDLAAIDGHPVSRPLLRAALWKLLAGVSGQFDARLRHFLPSREEGVMFSRELTENPRLFEQAFQKIGIATDAKHMPLMGIGEVQMLFADPQLGGALVKLLAAIEKLRTADIDRAPDGFQPLFN